MERPTLDKMFRRDFSEELILEIHRTKKNPLKSRGMSLLRRKAACANALWQDFHMFKKQKGCQWSRRCWERQRVLQAVAKIVRT